MRLSPSGIYGLILNVLSHDFFVYKGKGGKGRGRGKRREEGDIRRGKRGKEEGEI